MGGCLLYDKTNELWLSILLKKGYLSDRSVVMNLNLLYFPVLPCIVASCASTTVTVRDRPYGLLVVKKLLVAVAVVVMREAFRSRVCLG